MTIISGMKERWLGRSKTRRRKLDVHTHHPVEKDMKTVPCDDTIYPPRQLTEVLIEQARNIQMLPDVAVRAIAIADNPDSRIKELANVIAQDVGLTTNLVALANSPLFGFGKKVSCLQTAVTRLGFRQTKNMILASCYTSMLKNMNWQEEMTRDLLGRHSFLTGVISARLNSLFRMGMQGEEFTAGLVHDVGRTLLAVSIPHEFEKLDPLDFIEDKSLMEREMKSIGTTHAEVGAWFLQRNHLPEELISVARHHHDPYESSKYKRLIALVAVADDMSNYAQRTDEEKPKVYECEGLESLNLLESLGVEGAIETLQENAKEIITSCRQEVSQLLKI